MPASAISLPLSTIGHPFAGNLNAPQAFIDAQLSHDDSVEPALAATTPLDGLDGKVSTKPMSLSFVQLFSYAQVTSSTSLYTGVVSVFYSYDWRI